MAHSGARLKKRGAHAQSLEAFGGLNHQNPRRQRWFGQSCTPDWRAGTTLKKFLYILTNLTEKSACFTESGKRIAKAYPSRWMPNPSSLPPPFYGRNSLNLVTNLRSEISGELCCGDTAHGVLLLGGQLCRSVSASHITAGPMSKHEDANKRDAFA